MDQAESEVVRIRFIYVRKKNLHHHSCGAGRRGDGEKKWAAAVLAAANDAFHDFGIKYNVRHVLQQIGS